MRRNVLFAGLVSWAFLLSSAWGEWKLGKEERASMNQNEGAWYGFSTDKGEQSRFSLSSTGGEAFDAFVVNETELENYRAYLRDGKGKIYPYQATIRLGYKKVTVDFTAPSTGKFYLIIDNTDFPDGGAHYPGTFYYDYKREYLVASSDVSPVSPSSDKPTNEEIIVGTKIRILNLHPDDANYSSRSLYEGRLAVVLPRDASSAETGRGLFDNGGKYFGGQVRFTDGDGKEKFFYKVKVEVLSATGSPETSQPETGVGDRYMGKEITPGTQIRLLGLHKDDAFYSDRSAYIGRTGVVVAREARESSPGLGLLNNDDGYFGGNIKFSDGEKRFFFKAAVKILSSTSQEESPSTPRLSERFMGKEVAPGTGILVVGLHKDDASFRRASEYIGRTGTVQARQSDDPSPGQGLFNHGEGYFGGRLKFSDGESFFFYKVAVKLTGSAPRASNAVEFQELKFFEAGYTPPAQEEREFSTRFAKSKTRYIWYQVNTKNLNYNIGENAVEIHARYYKPDGSLFGEPILKYTIPSDWEYANLWHSWGWNDSGNWEPGTYRVELLKDGESFGKGSFTISGDVREEPESTRPSKTPAPSSGKGLEEYE